MSGSCHESCESAHVIRLPFFERTFPRIGLAIEYSLYFPSVPIARFAMSAVSSGACSCARLPFPKGRDPYPMQNDLMRSLLRLLSAGGNGRVGIFGR